MIQTFSSVKCFPPTREMWFCLSSEIGPIVLESSTIDSAQELFSSWWSLENPTYQSNSQTLHCRWASTKNPRLVCIPHHHHLALFPKQIFLDCFEVGHFVIPLKDLISIRNNPNQLKLVNKKFVESKLFKILLFLDPKSKHSTRMPRIELCDGESSLHE